MAQTIGVIDLFAGPGGLGEGFSAYAQPGGRYPFKILMSVEKDRLAHATLRLRSFYRQFPPGEAPLEYYQYLRQAISRESLFSRFPRQAERAGREAVMATLGDEKRFPPETVDLWMRERLTGVKAWVLIGGPPCQAYSIAGRSRMRPVDRGRFERDDRHFLYREYLRILAAHNPPIFVMENVKGLLSATLKGERTFDRIRLDLAAPHKALSDRNIGPKNRQAAKGYHLYTLTRPNRNGGLFDEWTFRPSDYVIECEKYGIPQARHRVILLGVREDLDGSPRPLSPTERKTALREVIADLPCIRSGLSEGEGSSEAWVSVIRSLVEGTPMPAGKVDGHLTRVLRERARGLDGQMDCGGEFVPQSVGIRYEREWYYDPKLGGVCNHSGRRHMAKDLLRYLYAACFAEVFDRSPRIGNFPRSLWPEHENVMKAVEENMFADRFRVQLWGEPSTTITSHMAKDGHHFIHPDPLQCRSLTVREAARIQTFPDNYFFEGPRTAQYIQVGNAVPPLLARQIAEVVHGTLQRAGLA